MVLGPTAFSTFILDTLFQENCIDMPAIVIHVKVLGAGKNPLTVLMNDSDQICLIKEKLSHQLFVPVDEQSLIFNGRTLDSKLEPFTFLRDADAIGYCVACLLADEKTLTSENLKDGCLVHLLLLKTHTHFDFTSRLHKFLSNSLPDDKKSMLITEHCVNYICDFIDSLSLDEIERYAKQKCLSTESSAGSSNSS
ncbi:hypothetical protein M513_08547 [Trichuris suis]|uniref:Ubiquitin-like domain-containing protein n=1 Tax=Trichuris suis TaxID=68888 RepID=A0A085M052_9BILA|nr:hypothetical protein M513_08547 [Trichuris suis]